MTPLFGGPTYEEQLEMAGDNLAALLAGLVSGESWSPDQLAKRDEALACWQSIREAGLDD